MYGNRTHSELCSNPPLVLKTRAITRCANTPRKIRQGRSIVWQGRTGEESEHFQGEEGNIAPRRGLAGCLYLFQSMHDGAAGRRQHLRSCPGSNPTAILPQGHVPHPVQPILDPLGATHQPLQPPGIGFPPEEGERAFAGRVEAGEAKGKPEGAAVIAANWAMASKAAHAR